MRYALLLLALFLAVSTPHAQTIYKSTPGAYIGLDRLELDSYSSFVLGANAGYRFANGLDFGGDVELGLDGDRTALTLGSRLGYTHTLAERFGLRTDARIFVGLSNRSFEGPFYTAPFGLDNYGVDASASLFRSVPLGRRTTLYPSAGFYVSSSRYAERKRADLAASVGEDRPTSNVDGGVQLGLPMALGILGDNSVVLNPPSATGATGLTETCGPVSDSG